MPRHTTKMFKGLRIDNFNDIFEMKNRFSLLLQLTEIHIHKNLKTVLGYLTRIFIVIRFISK